MGTQTARDTRVHPRDGPPSSSRGGAHTENTVVASEGVTPGTTIRAATNHYGLLRTMQSMLHLGCLARTCAAHKPGRPIGL